MKIGTAIIMLIFPVIAIIALICQSGIGAVIALIWFVFSPGIALGVEEWEE